MTASCPNGPLEQLALDTLAELLLGFAMSKRKQRELLNVARAHNPSFPVFRAFPHEVDPLPHVLEEQDGLRLAGPDDGWRQRPNKDARATSGYRAAIVARARFIEDLITEQTGNGVAQYVVLGAGPGDLRPA
ncbi:MAG: hypothetical protein JWP44_5125 [Mucilaginibacter sp.]|nr:hypothetical protein [Mucilaginibacter sp.]